MKPSHATDLSSPVAKGNPEKSRAFRQGTRWIGALTALLLTAAIARSEEMFPFIIPGLEPVHGVADVSWLNDSPAGAHGQVRVRDGHFVDERGKRIRFLATNFTFASSFPDHATAEKLALRLASLGINCIRFHHMDNQSAPRGIWKRDVARKNELDPDQLDRLDYFIAQLKQRGIYANINLHVSRNYWEGEEFPDGLTNRERQEKLPHYCKGLDKLNDQMIRMQREYARTLLTHVNPYTKSAYASEPCVAIVEINNENSLLQLRPNTLPDYYRQDVQQKWNAWLKTRYGSDEKLTAVWGGTTPLGENLLPNKWSEEQHGDKFYTLQGDPAGETHISLKKQPNPSWHAQLHQVGLTLEEGKIYTLEFAGRSDQPRELPVGVRLSKADWRNCGLEETAELKPQWQNFSFTFKATKVEPAAIRVGFVLGGGPVGDFWIKEMSLKPGGSMALKPGESLAKANVALAGRGNGTPRHADWIRFLAESERAYSQGMRDFLKKELGVKANIIDTQADYGGIAGCYRESFSDFTDMHSYWQHPHFPGKPWDGANWRIPNTPMVAAKNVAANLSHLASYRISGKPFTVSEYDHPAPSHYSAEMFPMLASFAASQDWDGLFQFDYGGTNWACGKIEGYFAMQQNPAKLAFLPAAALMFRRGDVSPARGDLMISIPPNQAEELTAQGASMNDVWKKAGADIAEPMTRRVGVAFERGESPSVKRSTESGSQIQWSGENALYTVDAPAAKAVVGRCTGKSTTLGEAAFEVQSNPRNFAVLSLNAADGKPTAQSERLLLTAAGNVENSNMVWNADHTSVSYHWGSSPTLCEGIAAKISFATQQKALKVFALTGSGDRAGELPVTISDGKISFEIGPKFHTLWYEIAVK